jgi:plasmid stabilization system protein ParE
VKLVLSQAAAVDIQRLRAFLHEKNPGAAERAVDTLISALDSLTTLANRGRPSGVPGVRELIVPFGQVPYVVRYALMTTEDIVVVLRIWHGRESR